MMPARQNPAPEQSFALIPLPAGTAALLFSCLVFKAILAPLLYFIFAFVLPAAAQTARHRTALDC